MARYFLGILSINRSEWRKVFYAWGLRILLCAGNVIGWTALVAFFVTRFSILALPLLFLIQSVLTILGMFLYSSFSSFFKTKNLIIFNLFAIATLLFLSTFLYGSILFFLIQFLVFGIFLTQTSILLSTFLEEFFTPAEGERLFPIIESAETIGVILGSLFILFFNLYFPGYKLFYVLVSLFVAFIGIIHFFEPQNLLESKNFLEKKEKHSSYKFISKFNEGIKEISSRPFLKGLLILLLIQAVIGQIIEFKFTAAVDSHVLTLNIENHQSDLMIGLGIFELIGAMLALIIEIFIASKIFKALGTVGSFLLHGLVTLFSSLTMLLGFPYFTSTLAKINFELSGIINKSAYENSFYAFRNGTQKLIREIFEALTIPFGSILGTFFLLAAQFFFKIESSSVFNVFLLIIFTVFFVFLTFYLQIHFTNLSRESLFESDDLNSRLNAIEILSQKGHREAIKLLHTFYIKNKNEKILQKRILKAFGNIGDMKSFSLLINVLKSKDQELICEALNSMQMLLEKNKKSFHKSSLFSQLLKQLRVTFNASKDLSVKIEIIRFFTVFKKISVVYPFIIDFLENIQESKNISLKSEAIIALWKLNSSNLSMKKKLHNLLGSENEQDLICALKVITKLKLKFYRHIVEGLIISGNSKLKIHAVLALFHLGNIDYIDLVIDLLLIENKVLFNELKRIFQDLDKEYLKKFKDLLYKSLISKIENNNETKKVSTKIFQLIKILDLDLKNNFKTIIKKQYV